MSESDPADRSTSNQVHEVTGTMVQASRIESMTVHYATAPPDPPTTGRGRIGRTVLVLAIAVVSAVVATLLVTGDLLDPPGSTAAPEGPTPTPSGTGSSSPAPTTTPAPIVPNPLETTTTTTEPPPKTPATPGPLSKLKPVGAQVFQDELIELDEKPGTRAKTADLSCASGTPVLLEETYDLAGAYRELTGRVAVRSEPSNAGPVTFTVLVGVRRLTLQAKASTCVGIGAAWAELTLSVP